LKLKNWLILFLKLAVAAGLVGYVLASGKIDFGRLKQLSLSPAIVLGTLGLLTAQLIVSAWRTQRLLRAHGPAPSFWTIVKLTFLGAFFDAVSITSVGGDAIKAWYLAQQIPLGRRTEAVSVLVVDRLLGLLGLLTLTLAAVAWRFGSLWSEGALRPYLIGLLAVCAGLVIGSLMLFSRRLHNWGPLSWILKKLPFGHTVERAYSSMQAFRGAPIFLLEGWLMSLGVHTLSSASGYVLASGLGMRGESGFDASLFLAALLIANFVCSFASFGAIGVGQAAFAFVFERVARLSGGADLATAAQVAFFVSKTPGILAWMMARKK